MTKKKLTKDLKRMWEAEYMIAKVGEKPILIKELNRLQKKVKEAGVQLVEGGTTYF